LIFASFILITDGTPKLFPKWHRGLDIKNNFGEPIYAMFNGNAMLGGSNTGDAGYFFILTSSVNGNTVTSLYFHMQDENRVTGTVRAGDLIGYQGDLGNLADAIKNKSTVSHLHIKIKENGITVNPEDYLKATVDVTTGEINSDCD